MIAFCITCKGRTEHLERTLPINLKNNAASDAKFLILDYGSQDNLLEYLSTKHAADIASGRVIVYSYRTDGSFKMAHAKNMAHRLGILEGAEVLINLDADNFTGEGFATWVEEQFKQQGIFLWAGIVKGRGRKFRGCSGRIGVSAHAFIKAGGYDERYETWSPDDKDFNARLCRLGYGAVEIEEQFIESVPHGDGIRFREYPHIQSNVVQLEYELEKHYATVVNCGNFGCGTVYKNFDFGTPIVLRPVPSRIFGVGLHKTATNSLAAALRTLKIETKHWESARRAKDIWMEMKIGHSSLTVDQSYALCDLPVPLLYKELDVAYPGSKFILTTRPEADWLESIKNHWNPETNKWRETWDTDCFTHRVHYELYGTRKLEPEVFLRKYLTHNAEVRNYFKDRPADLLELPMDGTAGWKELCGFLEKPIPDRPYPAEYRTGS